MPISKAWFLKWSKHVGIDTTADESLLPGPINNKQIFRDNTLIDPTNDREIQMLTCEAYKQLHDWYGGDRSAKYPIRNENKQPRFKTDKIVLKVINGSKIKSVILWKGDVGSKLKKEIKITFSLDNNFKMIQETKSGKRKPIDENRVKLIDIYADTEKIIVETGSQSSSQSQTQTEKQSTNSQRDSQSQTKSPKESHPVESQESKSEQSSQASDSKQVSGKLIPCNRQYSGKCGLHNLGNTCYFNSGIQCIMHSLPLTRILLRKKLWKKDVNFTNPLGMKGRLVDAFSSLTYHVWSGNEAIISPSRLKGVTGDFAEQFAGYGQQDPHELIMFMLDGIHEDLNRRKEKPQVETVTGDGTNDEATAQEAWKNHKLRNDSIIVDNFHGQLRSCCTCPQCHKTTVVFDPYVALSLPISPPSEKIIECLFIPYDMEAAHEWLTLKVSKTPTVSEYEEKISEAANCRVYVGFFAPGISLYSQPIIYWDPSAVKYSANTQIIAFEIPDPDAIYAPVLLYTGFRETIVLSSFSSSNDKYVMAPFLIQLPNKDFKQEDIEESVGERISYLWKDELVQPENKEKEETENKENKEEEKIEKTTEGEDTETVTHESKQIVRSTSIPDEDSFSAVKDGFKTREMILNDLVKDKEAKEQIKKLEVTFATSATKTEAEKAAEKQSTVTNNFKLLNRSSSQVLSEKSTPLSFHNSTFSEKYPLTMYNEGLTPKEIEFKNTMILTTRNIKDDTKRFSVRNVINMFNPSHHHENVYRSIITCNMNGKFMFPHHGFDLRSFIQHIHTDLFHKSRIGRDAKVSTLDDCFSYFTHEEVLDENNKWFCPHCREFVRANKKMDLWSASKCFIIQLKRFETTEMSCEKDERLIKFPEELDISPYIVGPKPQHTNYRLYAVSEHFGTLSFGHCTARATVPVGNHQRKWYSFNDSNCSPSSYEKAVSSGAYVLFYERIDDETDNDEPLRETENEFYQRPQTDKPVFQNRNSLNQSGMSFQNSQNIQNKQPMFNKGRFSPLNKQHQLFHNRPQQNRNDDSQKQQHKPFNHFAHRHPFNKREQRWGKVRFRQ